MITNLWQKIRLYCGNHPGEMIQMSIHDAPSGSMAKSLYGSSLNMFYSCPKYYPEYRTGGEKPCRNHISLKEFETMLNHISKIIEKEEASGGNANVVGEKWKSKQGVEFKVIAQSEKHIDIQCLNKKTLWKG